MAVVVAAFFTPLLHYGCEVDVALCPDIVEEGKVELGSRPAWGTHGVYGS